MLAELMRTKYSIAISGAHGKTTTTSIISHILIEGNYDPTVIIGGHLKNISANARWGLGDFLVAEADESDRSLLSLHATLAVVTNIDLEHLETYRDIDDIKQTFKQFLYNLPFYGKAVLCVDDLNVRSLLPLPHIKIIKYGIDYPADIWASDIVLEKTYSQCTVHAYNQTLGTIRIAMPGRHNILNTLAAIAITLDLEVPFAIIQEACANFKGVDRRFSFKGSFKGADVFDDYGHHPVEIKNTIDVARKRCTNKLIVVFQPHRYTRTEKLWEQFVEMFATAPIDHLIVTDIYAASEEPIPQITSQNLVAALQRRVAHNFTISYAPMNDNFGTIKDQLQTITNLGDLVLLQGAGKINRLATQLCEQ
jgi:UDP-N-acetylmuramate--alanine ligase